MHRWRSNLYIRSRQQDYIRSRQQDGETSEEKDEVMDLSFQISFNENEEMITIKDLRIVLRNNP